MGDVTGAYPKLTLALLALVAVVVMPERSDRPLPAGTDRPERAEASRRDAKGASLPADRVLDRRAVSLPTGATTQFHGRVLASADNPVANCAVEVSAGEAYSAIARTDPGGRFTVDLSALNGLTALRSADTALTVALSHPEYLPLREQVTLARARGEFPRDFSVESARGHVLGVVLDAGGRPVDEARVYRVDTGEHAWTKVDGRFAFDVRDRDTSGPIRLVAVEENHGWSRFVTVKADPRGTDRVELRLLRSLSEVSGTVLDLAGMPVPGHRLDIEYAEEEDPDAPPWLRGLRSATVFTDAFGNFRACGLEPGLFDVDFTDGLVHYDITTVVRTSTGDRPLRITVPLVRVEVQVVDRLGAALPGAELWFDVDPPDGSSADTRESELLMLGRERRLWLEPGQRGTLEAEFPGAAVEVARICIDDARPISVRLVLDEIPPNTGIRLRVERADGRALDAAWIHVWDLLRDRDVPLPLPSVGSKFLLPRDGVVPLMPGPYRVFVRSADDVLHPVLPVDVDGFAGLGLPEVEVRLPVAARVGLVAPQASFLPPESLRVARCGRSSTSWVSTEVSLALRLPGYRFDPQRLEDLRNPPEHLLGVDTIGHDLVYATGKRAPGRILMQIGARDAAPAQLVADLAPGINWFFVDRTAAGGLVVRPLQ